MNLPLTARRTGRVVTGLLVAALLLTIGAAPAARASSPAPEPVRVIVELTEPAALTASGTPRRVDQQQDAVVAAAEDDGLQITVRHRYRHAFNGLAVDVPAGEMARLRGLPGVGAVHPDRPVRAVLDDSVPLVGAPKVWPGEDEQGRPLDGTGQIVAVVDTGVDYTHPDLGGGFGPGHKVVAGYDFVNDDADPMDDHSHGTHVAAIAAGRADQPAGVTGVAPGAQVTAYKVLNARGGGTTATVLAGLDAAVAPDNPYRADVVNMSLGAAPAPDDPVQAAANAAVAAGVVVVAAAGNDGPAEGTVHSPAVGADVLAVGASTSGIREPAAALVAPVSRDLRPQRHWASANAADQPTEAEVVDVGHGRPEDFDGKDVAGKAVLVHTAFVGDFDIAQRAEAAGAVAALFHEPEPELPPTAARGVPEPTDWEEGRPDRIVSMFVSESDSSDIRRMLAAGPVRISFRGLPGDDRLAEFSSRGPVRWDFRLKPNLTAPGVEIRSALPTTLWPHGYYRYGGTSMAAPHVAGAAAIIGQQHPDWAARQVGSALAGTAGPVHEADPLGQGAGRLDLLAASRATVVAERWAIDFGLADLADPQVTGEAELPLANLGDTTATVELAGTDEVTLSPDTIRLGPGERATVTATLAVDRPTARRNLGGWVVATVAGGPTLRIPYQSAIRPLYLDPLPDPAVGETSLAVTSEVPLDAPPTVTITDPHGRSETHSAEPYRFGWVVRYQPRKRGVYRVTATGSAAGVTLYQETTFEAVDPSGGRRWEPVGPNFDGGALAFAPGRPGRAYALPDHGPGLYRTDDRGQSWHELRDLPAAGGNGQTVVADPRRPNTVYVAVNHERLYRGRVYGSHDAGRSWQALPVPDALVSDLAIDRSGRVLVLVGEAGTYASRDGGRSWQRLDAPDGVSRALVVGRDLYLASFDGLFVVRDVTGRPRPAQQLPVDGPVTSLAGDGKLLLAASGGAGYASTDRGTSWQPIFPAGGAEGYATGVFLVGDRIAVSTRDTAWLGDRDGTGWQPVPLPRPELGFTARSIESWPGSDTLVVGVTRLGVFATADHGKSYERIGVPGTTVHSVGVADGPDGTTLLLAGTWKGSLSTPLPGRDPVTEWGYTGLEHEFLDQRILALAAAPGKIYRTRFTGIDQLFVEQSTDGGRTWKMLATENGRPGDLVVHPADPDRLYLAVGFSQDAGVMVSRDGGTVWRRAEHTDFVAVAADPRHPDRLWLGGPSGLYHSVDGGETVTRLDSRPVNAIAVDPADPDRLLIGGERLRYSQDGGHTQHEAGYADLPLVVTDLEFGPDGTAYAATGGRGVLGSPDGGRSWAAIAGLPNRNATDLQLVPGWLYAATDGGGLYRLPVR